ncbi:MAG TPA: OmpA family protein [Thiotrichales bacterium]|nr:OmpA family protein [Thiotrichales bacterium]
MDILDNEKPVWQATTDLMTALMMVFMFIAIAFLIQLKTLTDATEVKQPEPIKLEPVKPEPVVSKHNAISFEKELNVALHNELYRSLKQWGAHLTDDNIIRFNANFKSGSADMPEDFAKVIEDFYPRYLKVLLPFKEQISELRIEGHTSDKWETAKRKEDIYVNNMQLSQARASSVLKHVYLLKNEVVQQNQAWLERQLRANGMAFANPIYRTSSYSNHKEIDENASRRVEFKVVSVVLQQ